MNTDLLPANSRLTQGSEENANKKASKSLKAFAHKTKQKTPQAEADDAEDSLRYQVCVKGNEKFIC